MSVRSFLNLEQATFQRLLCRPPYPRLGTVNSSSSSSRCSKKRTVERPYFIAGPENVHGPAPNRLPTIWKSFPSLLASVRAFWVWVPLHRPGVLLLLLLGR